MRAYAYLAHTFKHRKYVKEVLIPKIRAVGIETKNPFYEVDGTTKRQEVKIADEVKIQGIEKLCPKTGYPDNIKWVRMIRANDDKIVVRDLHFIDRTYFTIAYMTTISAGTMSEIFYTGCILKRPVFLLTDNPEVYEHPWVTYSCRKGKICKTEEELLRVLKRKYGKRN